MAITPSTAISRKPDIDYQVSMGLYVFEPAALGYIPSGQYLDFPDLVKKLLAAGERVVATRSTVTGRTWAARTITSRRTWTSRPMRAEFLPEE